MERYLIAFLLAIALWLGCWWYVDKEPPVVTITHPAEWDTVGGTVDITSEASDNEGVTSVEIYVDNNLKSTITSGPYIYSWNTDNLQEYSIHIIYAKAYDAARNEALSDMITVLVSNRNRIYSQILK